MASRGKGKTTYQYQWKKSGKRKKEDTTSSFFGSKKEESNNEISSVCVNNWKEPVSDGVELSAQQKYVLNLIRQGKNVFYTGNAGTGKTTLLREIRKCAPEDTFVTALTGVAAVQAGGTTLHSFAGIGLGNGTKENLCDIVRRGSKAKNWRKAKVLIVDEVSMLDGRLFDKLEYIARKVRHKEAPFGGLQLVMCGDFFQLPPIQKVGDTSINYCFQSKAWDECIDYSVELTQIYRQSDPKLIKLLYEVRYQCLSDISLELLRYLNRPLPSTSDVEQTKLYSHNARVNDMNNRKLMCLPGEEMIYTAQDQGQSPYVENMNKYVIAMDKLVLKKGAQVMLLKNLTEELINGSRGVVEGFDKDGVDLKNVFSQGQAYVALSRARKNQRDLASRKDEWDSQGRRRKERKEIRKGHIAEM
ncbi:hypothetical protein QZH41_001038 [Actinostola sp. cb2023]|nr:hypothetical protein QZH41_001038 [Actinostola sp. cb2023]